LTTIDCRNDQCPTPVVEARKAILAAAGRTVTILVGDETARENVSRMAKNQGCEVAVATVEGGYQLSLAPGETPLPATSAAPASGKTVALIAAETIGSGDDELGAVLMKNFLITLRELETPPEQIFFMNGGVKLTVTGSDALEALNQLACMGVDIASCGLCLDFFGLKEQLAVGRVGNMLETVQALASAGRVIRP